MPHRKTVRRVHEPGHLHELTFSCYRRLPLLTNHDWRGRLARSLDAASTQTGVHLVAFIFMPEHVHLLVLPTRPGSSSISEYLSRIKQPFSREIKAILEQVRSPLLARLTVRERPERTCFRFWQEGGGYDRNLFTPQAIRASLDYLHANPVRRGLCRRAIDWHWSSARYYENDPPGAQEPDLPRIDGLPPDALA